MIERTLTKKAVYYFESSSRYAAKANHHPVIPSTEYNGYACRAKKCAYRNNTCNKCKLKSVR